MQRQESGYRAFTANLVICMTCQKHLTPVSFAARRVTVRRTQYLGQIAQLVEQGIENPCVGGSIPSLATISSNLSESVIRSTDLPGISANFLPHGNIELANLGMFESWRFT